MKLPRSLTSLAACLPILAALVTTGAGGVTAAAGSGSASGGTVTGGTATGLQLGQLQRAAQTRPSFSGTGSASPSSSSHQTGPNVHRATSASSGTASGSAVTFPSVNCTSANPQCASITSTNVGLTTQPVGLAATANGRNFHEDIEPPDQGLCAGNGFVMESTNIGNIQVFDASSLQPVSPIATLDSLMGLTALGWSSAGDVGCLFDPGNGGHWFVTEIVSTNSEASGGPFTGCFTGQVLDSCREGLAVSSGSNPLTSTFNVYFLDPNVFSPKDPGHGFLLNDFGKIGNTRDAFLFFYDEFDLHGPYPACPAPDCLAFNGAQEFAFDKNALELGAANPNLVHENMGTDASIQPPDGSCEAPLNPGAGTDCWAAIIPAASPGGQFDNNNGGTGFMAGSLDFNAFATLSGTGDNRVAVFDWTGLSHLTSKGCSQCGQIKFGGQLFTNVNSYTDDGVACPASQGEPCSLAAQQAGTLDLGTFCRTFGLAKRQPCPENGLATNGDTATEASLAGGQLWFAINTLLNEQFAGGSEIHTGAAYWVINTNNFTGGSNQLTITSQGYVAAAHEDLEYATLVASDATNGVMSLTLSGDRDPTTGAVGGGFFPSSAYGKVSAASSGLVGGTLHVADLGQAPQDGFTEYQPIPGFGLRPRWGDYGAAIFSGSGFYFASEYIQFANCDPRFFEKVDDTCGGTRDPFANFGTSINLLVP